MAETKPQPRVIVFSTPTCSFCNMAKKYFREKGIKFSDVDVGGDPSAARDMYGTSVRQQGLRVLNENFMWTVVDNSLDFAVESKNYLTHQNRRYTIVVTYVEKYLHCVQEKSDFYSSYAPPVHYPSGPPA